MCLSIGDEMLVDYGVLFSQYIKYEHEENICIARRILRCLFNVRLPKTIR